MSESYPHQHPQGKETYTDQADLHGQLYDIVDMLHSPTSDDIEMYSRSSDFYQSITHTLRDLPQEDQVRMASDLNSNLVTAAQSFSPNSSDDARGALARIINSYSHYLNLEQLPEEELLGLAELSVVSAANDMVPITDATMNRYANQLYTDDAPAFVRSPNFTESLFSRTWNRAVYNDPDASPGTLLLNRADIYTATRLLLMSHGFTARHAAQVELQWSTMVASEEVAAEELQEIVLRNVETIQSIEKRQPGISARLYQERGIAHFGRYSEELLLNQFEPLRAGEDPDFVVMPHDDYNGAFYQSIENLEASLAPEERSRLRIGEVASPHELVQLVSKLTNSFGPALNVVIGGHGSTDTTQLGHVYFSREHPDTSLEIDRIMEQLQGFSACIKPNGRVILLSCSTGQDDAIAERIAHVLNRDTQAPLSPTNLRNVRRTKDGLLVAEFYSDGEARTITPVQIAA